MTSMKPKGTRAALALLLLAGFGGGTAQAAPPATAEVRESRSSYYAQDGRAQALPDRVSVDTYPGGDTATTKSGRRSDAKKGGSQRSQSPNTEFWFYAVDVELYGDLDLDGYFAGLSLRFDADTVYEQADVYAVLYLSREGGPWYEYAATDVFPLYGATSDDDYVVETDLLGGYPTGSYDILIELYDTWDNAFVADIGPDSSSALSYVPLEDVNRDEPYDPPDVVVIEDGGGAADPLTLALFAVALAGLALRRRRRMARLPVAAPRRAPRA